MLIFVAERFDAWFFFPSALLGTTRWRIELVSIKVVSFSSVMILTDDARVA
jgi:hypothetical protein